MNNFRGACVNKEKEIKGEKTKTIGYFYLQVDKYLILD